MKSRLLILLLGCGFLSNTSSFAQISGFMLLNRLGVTHQNVWGLDIGLVSYNMVFNRTSIDFFDVSFGVESIFPKPDVLSPKLNFDAGFENFRTGLVFGGGVDVALPTNFSTTTLMVTPKAGVSIGSLIRLYYGYNFIKNQSDFPNIGRHRVSLELNVAVFHSLVVGF